MHQIVCTDLVLYSSFHSTIYDSKYSITRYYMKGLRAMQHSQEGVVCLSLSLLLFIPFFFSPALHPFLFFLPLSSSISSSISLLFFLFSSFQWQFTMLIVQTAFLCCDTKKIIIISLIILLVEYQNGHIICNHQLLFSLRTEYSHSCIIVRNQILQVYRALLCMSFQK